MIYLLLILYILLVNIGCGLLWPNTVPITIKVDASTTVDELSQVYIKATTEGSRYNSSEKVTIKRNESSEELKLDYYGAKTSVEIYATYPISTTEFQSAVCSVSDIENTEPKTYTITYNGSLSCR